MINFLDADRHFSILKLLLKAPKGVIEDAILETALHSLGHVCSHDCFLNDLDYLRNRGLVTCHYDRSVLCIKITDKGMDKVNA